MSTQAKHVPLPGSHRNAVPGSSLIGPSHPHERIEVTRPAPAARRHPAGRQVCGHNPGADPRPHST